MIQLGKSSMVLKDASGEGYPMMSEDISVEILGEAGGVLDAEFVKHAAAAVLHYYRDELGKESITVAEFSMALEKILRGFGLVAKFVAKPGPAPRIARSDLRNLVDESSEFGELHFFPRLRDEIKTQLDQNPEMICFLGLRECVKRLSGAHRWTRRCRSLQEEIVLFLRSCASQDGKGNSCSIVVR